MLDNPELSYLNLRSGMQVVVDKLPPFMFNKWRTLYVKHREQTGLDPDFHMFVDFISKQLKELSLPNLTSNKPNSATERSVKTVQTKTNMICAYHEKEGHDISDCKSFARLNFESKKKFVSDQRLFSMFRQTQSCGLSN